MNTMTNDMKLSGLNALIYARVSRKDQAKRGDLKGQIEKLERWAGQHEVVIVGRYDEVVDGRLSSRADRPALHACIKRSVTHNLPVLVTDASRLTRNAVTAEVFERALEGRLWLLSRAPGFDGKSWVVEVKDKHAKLQNDVSTGTMLALDKKKRNRGLFGGEAGGRAGRDASAIVRTAESQARAQAIADYLKSNPSGPTPTCRELCALLDAAGIFPAQGKKWTMPALREPLRAAKELVALSQSCRTPDRTAASVGGVADTQDQTATPCVSASKHADANGVIDLHPAGPSAGAYAAQDAGKNASGVDIGAARALTDDAIMKSNPLYGRF
ncbi:recombinase family protein [Loktanella salsilacus]|uniref:recombinase family protein n=1 Tax=Loktanella salsilacus TaxID=195913 RepID=UPI003704C3CA